MTFGTGQPSDVTVVVASRNRRDDLLASLPRHEAPVVLVDNGSTDGTVDAVRAAHPEVTVLPLERNLYARARLDGATLVFGGQAIDGGYLDDLWLMEDGSADAIAIETTGPLPPARAGAEMVRDAAHRRVLLFGGRDGDGVRADTWQLSGALVDG